MTATATALDSVVSNADAVKLDELDHMLAEMQDLDLPEDADIVEDIEDVEDAEVVEASEDDLQDLEVELLKRETYDEATSSGDTVDDLTAEPPRPEKPVRVAKPRKSETAKAPKIERNLDALPPEVFVLFKDDVADASHKDATLKLRPAQKKIAEKFDNVLISLAAGRLPSNYVVDAFKLLTANSGMITSAELAGMWKARGLHDGTAASQTGQIMALFPALGIAAREGSVLVRNANSALAEKLAALIG